MPALPEVEVLRRDLEREVVTRRMKSVEVRPGTNAMKVVKRHGRRKELSQLLEGAKIDSVDRKGKKIFFLLDNAKVLVVDLMDSGRLLKTSASDDIAPHTHIVIDFTIGGQLRLVDPRQTSEIFVVDKDEYEDSDELRATGMDPLDNQQPITWLEFSSLLEEKSVTMKEFLMDPDVVCGLGDVYSDEVLFAAGLRHDRKTDSLTSQDVRRLYRALFETLQDAVKARGTSTLEAEFVDLQGNSGAYQTELKVFEREGQACPRCRSAIEKESLGQSFTYFCPQCQR